jgi:hypothetical protein
MTEFPDRSHDSSLAPPDWLDVPKDFTQAARLLLNVQLSKPGAAMPITNRADLAVTSLDQFDHSFPRQMHQVLHPSESWRQAGIAEPPVAYVMTRYSALPLTMTVRSFYGRAGIDLPVITFAGTSRHDTPEKQRQLALEDTERLARILPRRLGHLCIVDQATEDGHAILNVMDQINETRPGFAFSAMRGMWYSDARRNLQAGETYITPTITSYAHIFSRIGREAFDIYRQLPPETR